MRKGNTGMNVGGSSVLVIFILLSLTTFATLSLVSAQADLRLTERAAAAVSDYYAADSAAEELLAAIARALPDTPGEPVNRAEEYRQAVQAVVPGAAVEAEGGALYVRYAILVDDRQELQVALRLVPYTGPGSPRFTRAAWQVVHTAEWRPATEGLDLWGGEGDLFGQEGDLWGGDADPFGDEQPLQLFDGGDPLPIPVE